MYINVEELIDKMRRQEDRSDLKKYYTKTKDFDINKHEEGVITISIATKCLAADYIISQAVDVIHMLYSIYCEAFNYEQVYIREENDFLYIYDKFGIDVKDQYAIVQMRYRGFKDLMQTLIGPLSGTASLSDVKEIKTRKGMFLQTEHVDDRDKNDMYPVKMCEHNLSAKAEDKFQEIIRKSTAKRYTCANFPDVESMVDFLNRENIAKEDIINICHEDAFCKLVYVREASNEV